MFQHFALAGTIATVLSSTSYATVIADWTFESLPASMSVAPGASTPFPNANTTPSLVPAEAGANAAGSSGGGLHAGSSTYSDPAGNGSSKSLSSNTWAVNDYYQFAASTAGFSGIFVSFSQTSSNTGPRDFNLEYSTTGAGGPFVFAADYDSPANASPNAWSATVPVPSAFFSFDLSSIPALDNNTDVVFRLVDISTTSANGGTVATAGTSRVDDFTVSDSPIAPPVIPEPSAALALISGATVMLARRRRLS
jgi:hypothetical protein